MAKPQKKRGRPSWFQKQIERDGQDFLLKKQPLDIQREASNIVRDIIRGNITSRDYSYLFDLKVLSNVKIALYNKYIELHTCDSAMSFVLQTQNGIAVLENSYHVAADNLEKVFNNTRTLLTAYCAFLTEIDTMIGFVSAPYPKTQEDFDNIYTSIQFKLSKFRYINI